MTKNHGYRHKTRRLFRKNVRERGGFGLSRFMVDYEPEDRVDIIGDSRFQKRGLPHRHFIGKTGIVKTQRGRCYEVSVLDGGKEKILFIGREHIRLNKDFQNRKEAASNA